MRHRVLLPFPMALAFGMCLGTTVLGLVFWLPISTLLGGFGLGIWFMVLLDRAS